MYTVKAAVHASPRWSMQCALAAVRQSTSSHKAARHGCVCVGQGMCERESVCLSVCLCLFA